MKIKRVCGVYFSATKNTEKVVHEMVETIAQTLAIEKCYVNYTKLENRMKDYSFHEDDLVIFGSSVYAGRLPNKLISFVEKQLHGKNTLFIPVVTYGNRNYDEALKEAWVTLEKNGFIAIAACALPCQHAFTNKLATNRPDTQDLKVLATFTKELINHLENCNCLPERVSSDVEVGAYYIPRKEDGSAAKFLKAKPKTDINKCTHCQACAKVCPMQSISYEDEADVFGICIKCQACIKVCEQKAKYFDDEDFLSHVRMLENTYQRRLDTTYYSLFDEKNRLV